MQPSAGHPARERSSQRIGQGQTGGDRVDVSRWVGAPIERIVPKVRRDDEAESELGDWLARVRLCYDTQVVSCLAIAARPQSRDYPATDGGEVLRALVAE
jgi:hypothetical protein